MVQLCKTNFYGLEGEECLECQSGAKCPGSERFVDLVNASVGYWRENVTSPNVFCDEPRTRTRARCPIFQPCEPPWACAGDNMCAEGYEGPRCMYCLRGKYYRVNGECVKCPNNVYAVWIGLGLVLITAIGIAYFLNKRNINLALIAIGVDYFQVGGRRAAVRRRRHVQQTPPPPTWK